MTPGEAQPYAGRERGGGDVLGVWGVCGGEGGCCGENIANECPAWKQKLLFFSYLLP